MTIPTNNHDESTVLQSESPSQEIQEALNNETQSSSAEVSEADEESEASEYEEDSYTNSMDTPTVSFGEVIGGSFFSPGACFICCGRVTAGGLLNVGLSLLLLGFFVCAEFFEFFPLPGMLLIIVLISFLWIGCALACRYKTKAMIPGGRIFLASISLVTFWFPIVVSCFLAFSFMMQQTWMANDKMLPQIRKGDTVLVDRLTYRIHPPERGDLVLIQEVYEDTGKVNRRSFFARVIALPGDVIQIKNGVPYVNKEPLNEFYPKSVIEEFKLGVKPHAATIFELPHGVSITDPQKDPVPSRYYPIRVSTQLFFTQTESLKLEPKQYFVLVDNRDDTGFSYIKTSFGSIVHESMIKGQPRFIVYNSVDGSGFERFGYKLR